MKKNLVLAMGLCAVALLTSCKSRESAYRQAWEQAMNQDKTQTSEQQVTTDNTQTPVTVVTPVTPVQSATTTTTTITTDHSDVREINGNMEVTDGNALQAYSVVVGSFVTKANADTQMARLKNEGYDARIIKTNETINGHTGWYRVIASSFNDKASAAQSKSSLASKYPGAWILYRK